MNSGKNGFFSEFEYRVLYAVVWAFGLIPMRGTQLMGRILGGLFSMLPTGRRKIAYENITNAFGERLSEKEKKRLLKRVSMHFAQVFFEVPHLLRFDLSDLDKYAVFENEHYLREALLKGKGAFLLTAHFGNWELLSSMVPLKMGCPAAAVARPLDFAPADRLVNLLRSRVGTEIIPKKRGIRRILTAARKGKLVGILLDQNVDWYDGVFAPFLGSMACTNKGLALLAQKTGTPVVPIFSVRRRDGKYTIIIERELDLIRTGDKTRDVEENTALFNAVIEKYVRRHPDHWLWFHRRWKTRPYCECPEDYHRYLRKRRKKLRKAILAHRETAQL